ncbi:hypothetical protein [Aeromicrobium sp. Root344]|uniref:hypothetical protein n=1 Tax=Aeromicrobium sp. Root344 TaxID=1736521 RepID=UPI000AA7B02A|nr:hypothetical protein [Aeromicrobium sp. Root344]
MPNVVTPFARRRDSARPSVAAPRHRRDGYFDEHDQWHDSSDAVESDAARANG